jgi:hypothetical protein
MTRWANAKRVAVAALLVALAPVAGDLSALALSTVVAAVLIGLALWERSGEGIEPSKRGAATPCWF